MSTYRLPFVLPFLLLALGACGGKPSENPPLDESSASAGVPPPSTPPERVPQITPGAEELPTAADTLPEPIPEATAPEVAQAPAAEPDHSAAPAEQPADAPDQGGAAGPTSVPAPAAPKPIVKDEPNDRDEPEPKPVAKPEPRPPVADRDEPPAPAPAPKPTPAPRPRLPKLYGVNLSGADWGEGALPGVYNTNYTWPTKAEVDHFTALGMNVFRLPFRWERLQREQFGPFDAAERERLTSLVSHATKQGAYVLIDPHNYARYYGQVIGQGVPVAAFQDLWTRLANMFKDNPRVIFGVMNEPMDMSTELWLKDANAAISAIRATGAKQLILVPGNAWSGAHSWLDNWYGTPNGTVMKGVRDPGNNFAIEVHQYMDPTSGGTDMNNCPSPTIGSQRLVKFTNWLKQNNMKAFLGEFGAGTTGTCLAAIDDMLSYIDNNSSVWLGWTWWAAGPWWSEGTEYSIEPVNGRDRPQTTKLLEHMR